MKEGLKIGDQVIMVNCLEAQTYKNRIWKVRSSTWNLCGTEVVLLEGYTGGFATEFLKKLN